MPHDSFPWVFFVLFFVLLTNYAQEYFFYYLFFYIQFGNTNIILNEMKRNYVYNKASKHSTFLMIYETHLCKT